MHGEQRAERRAQRSLRSAQRQSAEGRDPAQSPEKPRLIEAATGVTVYNPVGMPDRGHVGTAPAHPRFRCRVCREFVVGTQAGHCPRCGIVPPSARVIGADEPSRFRPLVVLGLALTGLVVALAANAW